MKGAYRYGKSIAAAMLLSAFGFVGRYGGDWLFPHVDPLPGPNSVMLNVQRAAQPVRVVDVHQTRGRIPVVDKPAD